MAKFKGKSAKIISKFSLKFEIIKFLLSLKIILYFQKHMLIGVEDLNDILKFSLSFKRIWSSIRNINIFTLLLISLSYAFLLLQLNIFLKGYFTKEYLQMLICQLRILLMFCFPFFLFLFSRIIICIRLTFFFRVRLSLYL